MFFSIRSLSTALALASFVAANPVQILSRSSSQTLANNFTLAALNNTLPNANTTGAPLVLAEDGATDGASFEISATYASTGFNDFPLLSLVDGNLRAFNTAGNWLTNASTGSGEGLNWVTSGLFSTPADTGFSAVTASADSDFPVLAYNGITDLWYLCPSDRPIGATSYDYLYFNATTIPSQSGVEGASPIQCYSVTVNMVSA